MNEPVPGWLQPPLELTVPASTDLHQVEIVLGVVDGKRVVMTSVEVRNAPTGALLAKWAHGLRWDLVWSQHWVDHLAHRTAQTLEDLHQGPF